MNRVQIGDNVYCGPAALSIISGRSVDHCAAVIGSIIGKAPEKVKAVYTADFLKAAKKLRIDYQKVNLVTGSIYATAHFLASHYKAGNYLVTLPKHYIVIEVTEDKKALICDNHTKVPIGLEQSARLSQRVEECYKVSVRPEAVFTHNEIEIVTVPSSSDFGLYINVIKHYENPEDNTKVNKGLFRASKAELADIIVKLTELRDKL